jgi:hypothetical protein
MWILWLLPVGLFAGFALFLASPFDRHASFAVLFFLAALTSVPVVGLMHLAAAFGLLP